MKKTLAVFLAAILAISSFTVCSAAQAVLTVHSVDEFIASIAPGAVIQLEEGSYNLAEAETYGKRSGNPYVKWVDSFDGYELQIHDLDNLTIRGQGAGKTTFISESINAEVLSIDDCTNVRLESFTAGHNTPAEGCAAGVIGVTRSDDVTLSQLGLYGCGSVGVHATASLRLSVLECEIYDCSYSGIDMNQCQDVVVDQCNIHNIGKMIDNYNMGWVIFGLYSCENVLFSDCTAKDSDVSLLTNIFDSRSIRFSGCSFVGNSATEGILGLHDSEVVIESGCSFLENTFSHWYSNSWGRSDFAVDENGEPYAPEDPAALSSVSAEAEARPVIPSTQKRVEVATVDEFLNAIGSNTEIVLTGKIYDLSTASEYNTLAYHEAYSWEDAYDGPALVIHGVENLSIVSDDGNAQDHVISATPRYANVLSFRDCSNVMVQGFTAGHTIEPGSCAGGVLDFENCRNCLVDQCRLFGCGILGVNTRNVHGLQIINSQIYECSYGGIQCFTTEDITIGGCDFWDLGGAVFQFTGCIGVTVNGQEVAGNYCGD